MAGSPPDWGNVRWPGSGGLRVPTEMAPASLGVKKLNSVNIGTQGVANVVTLLDNQCSSSYLIVTNASGAATINWPAAFPGLNVVVYNNSGQNVTFKVAGQVGVLVANGKRALLMCEQVDIARVTADT